MRLHELAPAPGSTRPRKRLGRGIGSGLGKTSGKGQKGQKSRSGGGKRPGFEGGQLPLIRRLPKRGFTNEFKKEYAIVNVHALEGFQDGAVVDDALLMRSGLIKKPLDGVKVLGSGDLTKSLTVRATLFTRQAKEKIEAAGGKAEVV